MHQNTHAHSHGQCVLRLSSSTNQIRSRPRPHPSQEEAMSGSGGSVDFVARPLELVERVVGGGGTQQEQGQGQEQDGGGSNGVHTRVVEAFRARLREQGPAALAAVPVLHPDTWQADRAAGKLLPNTLVRFRGMVQDMLDPQFFVGVQRHAGTGALRCALYADGPGLGLGLGQEEEEQGAWEPYRTMERRPLILTPIPGEAPWVMEGLLGAAQAPVQQPQQPPACSGGNGSNKRALGEEYGDVGGAMEVEEEVGGQQQGRGGKAPRIAAAGEEEVEVEAEAMAVDGTGGASSSSGAGGGLRCLSYLYGGEEDDDEEAAGEGGKSAAQQQQQQQQQPQPQPATPRLNEAVDVLAVLCYTPAGVPMAQPPPPGGEGQDEEEAAMEQLLLGLEPRLHIVLWAPAPALLPSPAALHDPTPFLHPSPNPTITTTDNENDDPAASASSARAALLARLTALLAGDALAAEYFLLALLARVRLRTPAGEVVGPLPLNLSRASPETAARLARLLQRLCPRSRALRVDLPTLDDPRAFIPRKDPAKLNVLESTPLQVCPGTALLVDETGLDSGRLGAEGVANLRCLQGLIERQTLPCHFGFYQLDFPTDCPVLVVSKSRSILGGGSLCQVPHSPPSDPPPAQPEPETETGAMDEEEALRRYLAAAAAKDVEIDAEIAARAEREFVGLRAGAAGAAAGAEGEGQGPQENKGQQDVTPETLGRWLTLCRLLCAAEGGGGNGKVGERHWERMRALEEERVGRLRALGLDPPAQ